jgi:Leucine Rich repeat/Leucine Rich Repeat
MRSTPTSCPAIHDVGHDLSDLEPLLAALAADTPVNPEARFARGTLHGDGRLDLCKQRLGVRGCRQVVAVLSTQRRVDAVLLGTNAIGDEGAREVASLIAQGRLETVYLGCNGIGARGAGDLSSALETDTRVRALWLKRNPLGPDGVRRVAHMLQRNASLRTLDLVNTAPDHAALVALLEAVAAHPSLEYLYLSGNGLDREEAPSLAACLRESRLKGLYLSVNHLENDGVEHLAAVLEEHDTLAHLGLASNGITDGGLQRLCASLVGNRHLRSLDLGRSPSAVALGAPGNVFCNSSLPALRALLGHNTTLVDLNLHPNGFTDADKRQLHDLALQKGVVRRLTLGGRGDALWQPVDVPRVHADADRIRSVYR